jgi:hypothetical protein
MQGNASQIERSKYAPPTAKQIGEAAYLCALDEEKDEEIAARLGMSRRSLARWKRRADFQAAYHAACRMARFFIAKQATPPPAPGDIVGWWMRDGQYRQRFGA